MGGYEDLDEYEQLERYTAELKRLLAGRELSPDTRARSLAALIEADAAMRSQNLPAALQHFAETAEYLADNLGQQERRLRGLGP